MADNRESEGTARRQTLCMSVSCSNEQAATGGSDSTIHLYDLATHQTLQVCKARYLQEQELHYPACNTNTCQQSDGTARCTLSAVLYALPPKPLTTAEVAVHTQHTAYLFRKTTSTHLTYSISVQENN